ncbi:glycylpeptide N tetradecanoyltransferase 2 [Trichuris trichiura]|uniref:Glycylpeptide N-tetradecanoyltransferase n=1 Tax=Trichuris trichiura TaxID=36087 RepID=A0A077ZDL5_TRITR|nr:glycylpeptide N tetradecanoyltransferase 2 [Trichuris trichiura]
MENHVENSEKSNDEKPEESLSESTSDGANRSGSKVISVVEIPELELRNRLLTLLTLSAGDGRNNTKAWEIARQKSFQFWDTQPVPKFDEVVDKSEPLQADKEKEAIRQEPYSLPDGFEWSDVDTDNDQQMYETYKLLSENYVEDDENMFRFDYSLEFLRWALRPPGWQPGWFIGVRVSKSKKMVGFISAIPATIRVYNRAMKMVEINFLCVHKKLRSKRMAPVLIREVTRRVHLTGIFQAVYTAGVVLPRPVSSCCYWHRSLNPKKLIDVKFSQLGKNMTLQRAVKLYKLPKETKTPGMRRMEARDVKVVRHLLDQHLGKFDLAPVFSLDEMFHWFMPRQDIIDSYVVEDNGVVTDFVSYYTLPSTVMHHPVYKSIRAAYLFYSVSTKTPINQLIFDALILAKNAGYDVFNALDLMDNSKFLEELKFGVGDGHLQYYLYNWKCPEMPPEKVIKAYA